MIQSWGYSAVLISSKEENWRDGDGKVKECMIFQKPIPVISFSKEFLGELGQWVCGSFDKLCVAFAYVYNQFAVGKDKAKPESITDKSKTFFAAPATIMQWIWSLLSNLQAFQKLL